MQGERGVVKLNTLPSGERPTSLCGASRKPLKQGEEVTYIREEVTYYCLWGEGVREE